MRLLAILLSFSMGFLSLSQEIVWVRIVGFVYAGKPQGFAYVLVMFLAGIALGAYLGKKACERFKNIVGIAGWALFIAGLVDLGVLLYLPHLFSLEATYLRLGLLSALIVLTATAKSVLFPVVHHMGSSLNDRLGRSVSQVYFANIAGSTTGPLITGLVLLDYLSSANALRAIAACTLALAAITLFRVKSLHGLLTKVAFAVMAVLSIGTLVSIDKDNHELIYAITGAKPNSIRYLVENRHGIIHVVKGENNADKVYGGNVYDGHTTTDLHLNINGMDRAYLLHALKPSPKRVLVIGLATGAWVKVLTMDPKIERIDVVEINPAYRDITRNYPALLSIFDDPRVHIHITDGRHYLRATEDHFDLILMNTTWNWRAYATNLLSVDFERMVKAKLNPDGVFAFNSTWSPDAFFTVSSVFKYAFVYGNFVYAADHELLPRIPQAKERLLELTDNGVPVFDPNSKGDQDAIAALINKPTETIDQVIAKTPRKLEIITDQNMITEFKYGIHLGRRFAADEAGY